MRKDVMKLFTLVIKNAGHRRANMRGLYYRHCVRHLCASDLFWLG